MTSGTGGDGSTGSNGSGFLRRVYLALIAGFVLSVLSASVGSFATSFLPVPGPSGIIGGWPLSFVEYDSDLSEDILLPSGVFLIPGRDLPLSFGELYPGFFAVNWLLLSLLSALVILGVSVVRTSHRTV